MKHILIVEDDADIQELLQNFLEAANYIVTLASDGVEAIARFHEKKYDLVLLDVLLPKIDGYSICELIRKESTVPIIMVTALDSEANQIKGFDMEIDDYVTKPFSMEILLRKISAVLRRTAAKPSCNQISYQGLILDIDGYQTCMNGQMIDLTLREFELLRELLTHQGKVLTRQMLLNRLWEYDFYGDERVVDTHIKNLRKKLGVDYIETIRGVGYRIDKEN
ncbi:response regulator transcription factor [Tissierella carlieri]|uniref:Response regulator transcription factor n=1 Tax=Tissierella carlieri TaxID=689904 RepID=A0ABT1SD89_9FIRM|nr:response regulator transcription factor [Tissierella carlieri]MCQ4924440.1 response regulator transcription factor [Tissierella carlieri]